MGHSVVRLLGLFSFALFEANVVAASAAGNEFAAHDTITRDVVILGGGSAGTYAGIRLKDQGKSITIIEKNDYLGGHGETFYTSDDRPVNYGVEGFFNDSSTFDYLDKLNVPYEVRQPGSTNNVYMNLRTGEKADGDGGSLGEQEAIRKWVAAISQFTSIEDGSFNLPDPIPEDILLTLGEFVKKYDLEDAVQGVFSHGVGTMLDVPVLYVIQLIGVPHAAALRSGYIRPVHGIAELYKRASKVLNSDVLYQTTIESTKRSGHGVEIVVRMANGKRKLIKAKQLLLTVWPTLDNLSGFDLDKEETDLFKKWHYKSYYVAVVNDTGIPNDVNLVNTDPDQKYSLPLEPFIWRMDAQKVPGYLAVKLVGGEDFSASDAKELLRQNVMALGEAGTYPTHEPEIIKFASHTPVTMKVSADEVRNGFYRKLYALQGHQNTFYTGATFCSDYSTLLWQFTDKVMEQMDG